MFKYSMAFLLAFTALSAWAGNTVDASNSATAQKYLAGCGFDYKCDSSGNKINNVPIAPQVRNSDPNTVQLGGGKHTVEIISQKPKQKPLESKVPAINSENKSVKQTATPRTEQTKSPVPEYKANPADTSQGYGIDYIDPKKLPKSVGPKQPTEQPGTTNPVLKNIPPYSPKKVTDEEIEANLPTGPHIKTKAVPLPGQENPQGDESKWVQSVNHPIEQPPLERSAGAREIIETHKGEVFQTGRLSDLEKQEDTSATKPDTQDVKKQKTEKDKQPTEEKTKIKKLKLNQEQKTWKNGENTKIIFEEKKPKEVKQKVEEVKEKVQEAQKEVVTEKSENNKGRPMTGSHHGGKSKPNKARPSLTQLSAQDPFASNKALDSKRSSKRTSSSSRHLGRGGVVSYGGDSELELQKQANANKQARIAREQAQKDADAAFFAGMITDTMMNATINHIDAKNAKKKGGGGGTQTVTYETYDDYSPDDDYTYTQKESKLLNQAKKMTGGGGW